MTLGQKQALFTRSLALLLQYMIARGFEPRLKFVSRCSDCPVGHENSTHKSALAADIDLFLDGIYLTETEHHRDCGEFWESLGDDHSWGGRFDDGNHYSIAHNGVR